MALDIKNRIYWVGAVDWNVRSFHGHTYSINRGTTYNAYLIIDEKNALVDTVAGGFADEMINKVREILPLVKIDYIIANHVETDHSGALPQLLRYCPEAKVIGTAKCKEGLYKHYYGNWHFQTVKTGDKLVLGKRTLEFIEAPMIHWPDSMFTYCRQEELLMSNDAFGQHYAASARFDDQADKCALMDEAAKYYANILWPLGGLIQKKIEELQKNHLPMAMIAPSHGVIWRKDPASIVQAYLTWAKNETRRKITVVYETMWSSTAKMAASIAQGAIDAGVEVKLFDIASSDRTEIIKDMLDSRAFIIGSSTHDNGMLPAIAGFLQFLKGLKPKGRVAFAFGSYGWAGGAVAEIENTLKAAGMEMASAGLQVKYVPDESEINRCYDIGRQIAQKL